MSFGAFSANQPQQQQQQQPQPQPQPQQSNGAFGYGLFQRGTQPAAGTSGGLFGSAQPTGGGLFGATNTNTNAPQQGGGGLFGNTGQQSTTSIAPAGGSFGSTAQTGTAGGGLFGATNTNPATNTGGLFGSATGNALGGSGLFGSTTGTNTGGNPFGNAGTNTQSAPGGSLFGSTTTNAGPTAPTGGLFGSNTNTGTTGGLFGNTTANTNTTTAPSGGLFNTTTTAPAGGGWFGNTNAAPSATGTAGGLFGSTTNAPNNTGGLFGTGQPSTSTAQPSLFGTTNQAPGSSLFGSTQQQQQQAPPGSLFNTVGQQQKPTMGGLFGGSAPGGMSTIGGSSLLGPTNNLFASKPAVAPNPQQDAQSQYAQLSQTIEFIYHAWNNNSPQCRFQHYFYNLVDPSQVHQYGRPANATNEALWQKAVRENPDPSCFVPALATGFDDVQKRVEAQAQQAAAHQERIKDLQTRISALAQRHQLSNASRLQRATALQTQLTHRVLKLVQHLHLLIPALRSSALRPEEEALRTALEEIDEEVRRPGGTGRIRGKLNELWALVGAVSSARERDRRAGGVEWTVVDEEGLGQITQILMEEQAGLAHLTKLLQKDMKDLAVIQGSSPQDDDPDSLASSTATMRASTM